MIGLPAAGTCPLVDITVHDDVAYCYLRVLASDLSDQLDQLDYLSFFERLNSVASVNEFNANRNVVDAGRVIGDLRRRHDLRCGSVPANDVMSFVPGGLENFSPELRIVVSLADGPELHRTGNAGRPADRVDDESDNVAGVALFTVIASKRAERDYRDQRSENDQPHRRGCLPNLSNIAPALDRGQH